MKRAENRSESRMNLAWIFRRVNNQDGASLMAALLFFVLCSVGASILLASTTASAGKIRQLPDEDQKRYAVDSAAAFLRDELLKTENIVKIREVIVEDSRDDDVKDDFACYYVGSSKNLDNESSWNKFYDSSSSDTTWTSGTSGAILDSMIVDIYENNEYRKQSDDSSDSEDDSENGTTGIADSGLAESSKSGSSYSKGKRYKDFTLSVKKSGTGKDSIEPLKTNVRLYMADNYKITAVVSDTVTAPDMEEERSERRLQLEALTSKNQTVSVEVFDDDDEDSKDGSDSDGTDTDDGDESYTITTTTILTTIKWQNGTIEKELLEH